MFLKIYIWLFNNFFLIYKILDFITLSHACKVSTHMNKMCTSVFLMFMYREVNPYKNTLKIKTSPAVLIHPIPQETT